MPTAQNKVWSRTLTLLAVGAASVALAGCSLIGNVAGGTTGTDTGTDTPAGATSKSVFDLAPGDCLLDGEVSGSVDSVLVIDCSKPHDSEAYDAGTIDDGDFNSDTVNQAAEALCGPSFETFTGAAYSDEGIYDYSYYTPTEESWNSGDRAVLCVAFAKDASQVSGTLKGISG